MIEFISFVIFIVIFFILVFDNLRLRLVHRSNIIQLLEVATERNIIATKLLDFTEQNLEPTEAASEGFLKFISDSREWAFEYIENVQVGINKFISDAGPAIEYWEKYGSVMDTPLDINMQKISISYKELKSLLPEDYGKIDT
jgi:hypothetical protein